MTVANATETRGSPVLETEPSPPPEGQIAPAAPADLDLPPDHRLTLDLPVETRSARRAYLVVALALAAGYLAFTQAFWAPAHGGVDQNAYLGGGRAFAETFSTGLQPYNPFEYFGAMWVQTEDGWMYPKYPLGIPILTAICFWIGGETHGPTLTYLVSPTCASLALVAMFLLARQFVGSFGAVLAQILLATNAVLLSNVNNPWSHAPGLAFVLWGMTFLLWWWRFGGPWRGAAAGLLLGFALLIRYTEGLLLIPMALVAADRLRWTVGRSYLRASVPFVAWAVPVGTLLAFNRVAMGAWTGYDFTNESTGFRFDELAEKWRFAFAQLYLGGAFFVFPLGLVGLAVMFRWNWRAAAWLTAWLVPGVLVYSAYYWGENAPGNGYLRFFLTLLPPVLLSAVWLLVTTVRQVPAGKISRDAASEFAPARAGWAVPVIAGVVVLLASSATLKNTLPQMEREFTLGQNLAAATEILRMHTRTTPRQDVMFFGEFGGLYSAVNHLSFATGFETYAVASFDIGRFPFLRGPGGRGGGPGGPDGDDAPTPLQPRRREAMRAVYDGLDDAALVAKQNELMASALGKGRRVLVLLPENEASRFLRRFVQDRGFRSEVLATWRDPARLPETTRAALDRQQQQWMGQRQPPRRGGPGMMNPMAEPRDLQLIEIRRK